MPQIQKSFEENFEYSDRKMPEVIQILKDNLDVISPGSDFPDLTIKEATFYEDTKESTDLKILSVSTGDKTKSIAVRVRKPDVSFRDLTIRARTKSGAETEIDKIRKGMCELYIYCWEGLNRRIRDYILVDIDQMRKSDVIFKPRTFTPNGDGTGFYAYSIKELKLSDCLIRGIIRGKVI